MKQGINCKLEATDLFLVKDKRDNTFLTSFKFDFFGVSLSFSFDVAGALIFDQSLLDAFFSFTSKATHLVLTVVPFSDVFVDDASDPEVTGDE